MRLIFVCQQPIQKYFNNENFPIYGIKNQIIVLNEECDRLEKILAEKARFVCMKSRVHGRKRETFLSNSTHVFVLQNEVLSPSAQIQKLQEKMKDLYKEIADEYDRIQTPMENKGRTINQVSERHARSKLSEFKTKAGQALWFAGSFGLELDFMQAHTRNGKEIKIKLSEKDTSAKVGSSNNDNDSDVKIKQILYLLDKFGVGDEFYHELSMIDLTLPRSYQVKKKRTSLNSSMDIQYIPGFEAAHRPLLTTLQEEISRLVSILFNKKYYMYVHRCKKISICLKTAKLKSKSVVMELNFLGPQALFSYHLLF